MKISHFAAALCTLATVAAAATSTVWETSSFAEFEKGRLRGVSLMADGYLKPGPSIQQERVLDQPILWSVAAAADGTIYAGTGHRGKVYRIPEKGQPEVIWTAGEAEVFAVTVDRKGRVYAATSPNGAVYRIDNGKATEIFRTTEKYIWALQAGADDSLFAGTGEAGRIYRIDPSGKAGQLYYDTGQTNVTALTVAPNGRLYAGTDPNGILYEITSAKQGSVLYDSNLPEVHSIRVAADGTVYAAAIGGSLASRTTSKQQQTSSGSSPVVSSNPTVVTVSEAHGTNVAEQQQAPGAPQQPKASVSSTMTPVATPSAPAQSVQDVAGADKSAIYKISADRTVETLRTSKDENVYDLLLRGPQILFSTDTNARIYSIGADRKISLLSEIGDGEPIQMIEGKEGMTVALSSPAKLLTMVANGKGAAEFESPVHDTNTNAHWGRLWWQSPGAGISFETRTGNSARPDATWSGWSKPVTSSEEAAMTSPQSRFVQWRAKWKAGSDTQLDSVVVPFLPQNAPPSIRSIGATSIASNSGVKTSSGAASGTSPQGAISVTVTDTGDVPTASSSSSNAQGLTRQTITQTQVSWQADDPDNDRLSYTLFFRGEGEKEWKLIRRGIFDNTVLLDSDGFADGRYNFKVIASDAPANAKQYAKESELVSPTFLVDNTPPMAQAATAKRDGSAAQIDFKAEDAASPLRRAEYAVDAGAWQPIEASDGVTDSMKETFHVRLDSLAPGEHLVVLRVFDSVNNAGLAKAVVR